MSIQNKPRPGLARLGRWLVQAAFLLLFLFPLAWIVYQKATFAPAPTFTSWLLPWDPVLFVAQLLHGDFSSLVIGAPLLLLALSLVFGRFLCGWICPLGTLLDLTRGLVFWRKRKAPGARRGWFAASRNSLLRFFFLAFLLGTALVSLKYPGLFDPLVVFQRASTTLGQNSFSAQRPGLGATASLVSLVFLATIALELWQPRFWCRNLCPLGALISLISHFSLFKRQISIGLCNLCQECRRDCPMNAIPKDAAATDYSQCTFCLECAGSCVQGGITFGFGQPTAAHPLVRKAASASSPTLTRRHLLAQAGAACLTGLAGAALAPLTELAPRPAVLRPPGAMPEAEFLRACILCQECVRVCPTGALRPALLESGLAGLGTPVLVARQGACTLNPSCPDLCARVCPVGAIQPRTLDQMKIGLAVVHRDSCLAWDQGAHCLVCVEACLVKAAIPFNGRVTVDAERCTGCGRCETGCPVPGSAIHVVPLQPGKL
ncbi:MAG TPA: 4Fe-4S binding protein [Anaerolineaceae bacterium]|nr:4Fe-4S binding protein [Anaerolineaceae bacterium]